MALLHQKLWRPTIRDEVSARIVQRKASSPQAQGADAQGFRYVVQLALEGVAHQKKKHTIGSDTIGADVGPSTIALVPREAEASLSIFCAELRPDAQAIRRLQQKMDRQRRAANPLVNSSTDCLPLNEPCLCFDRGKDTSVSDIRSGRLETPSRIVCRA